MSFLRYNPPPMNCPRCQKAIPGDASKCSACGFSFDDATQQLESPSSKPGGKQQFSSYDSIDDARFVPGAMLAERYRIVGLLGKGGMGEVYRADDLKLGQPVLMMPFTGLAVLLAVFVVYRYGLLAMVSANFFFHVWVFYPMTTEVTAWYAFDFVIDVIICGALVVYGFYISLAGQPLFGGKLLEE